MPPEKDPMEPIQDDCFPNPPAALVELMERSLQKAKIVAETSSDRLFLKYPQGLGCYKCLYYLANPTTQTFEGLVLGLSDEDMGQRWNAITVGKGARAYSRLDSDSLLMTFDCLNRSTRVWQRFNRGGESEFCQHTDDMEAECDFYQCIRVFRTDAQGRRMLGTFRCQVGMPIKARIHDAQIETDCVYDRNLGGDYLHIAAMLCSVRMWIFQSDFRSGD